MIKRTLIILAFLPTVCFGGGVSSGAQQGPHPPVMNDSPGGIWDGTLTSNVTAQTFHVLVVVTELGEARFLMEQGPHLFGTVSVNGHTVTANLTGVTAIGVVWPDGSTVASIAVNGTVNERGTLFGSYSGGGDNGTFSTVFDPIYDRKSNLATTAGAWVLKDLIQNTTAAYVVDAMGIVIGLDTDGCAYNGNVTIVDSNFNVYRASLTISNCIIGGVDFNGAYTGFLVMADLVLGSGLSDAMIIGLTSLN